MTTGRRRLFIVAGAIALLTLAVFLTALRNDFVNWDDYDYVTGNVHIRSLDLAMLRWAVTDLSTDFWLPVTWISHALDVAFWGMDPAGHHLTGILLHSLNSFIVALLVFDLLGIAQGRREEAGSRAFPDERAMLIAAGATALLFGLHPLHVESVAWVSERKDLLATLFSLLALSSYVRHTAPESAFPAGSGRTPFLKSGHYVLCLGLFVLALASKPMAVTLPLVFLLFDWYPLRRIRRGKDLLPLLAEKVPFLLLSSCVAVLAVLAQKAQGAVISTAAVPLGDRILVAAQSIVVYLGKMALPLHLLPVYPFPEGISLRAPAFFLPVALVLAITAACVMQARRRVFLAAWSFYLITLLPVLGLVKVGTVSIADRYTYFASLGPFLLAGLGAARLWTKADALKEHRLPVKRALIAAALVAVATLSLLTVRQIALWRDSLGLWTYELENSAQPLPLAYNNRGLVLKERGRLSEALADYAAAIRLNPWYSHPYTNRGIVLDDLGRGDEALEDFDRAIALDPNYADSYRWRGAAYRKKGLLDRAVADLTQAIRLRPDDASLYVERGALFREKGDLGRAVGDLTTAIARDPSSVEAYIGRGMAFKDAGQFERAIADDTAALRLRPTSVEAYNNRGAAYKHLAQYDRALADYDRAIELDPSFALAYMNRGAVLSQVGRYDKAIGDFSRTISLQPDFGAAWFFRGEAYRRTGKSGLGQNDLRKACGLGYGEACAALGR